MWVQIVWVFCYRVFYKDVVKVLVEVVVLFEVLIGEGFIFDFINMVIVSIQFFVGCCNEGFNFLLVVR